MAVRPCCRRSTTCCATGRGPNSFSVSPTGSRSTRPKAKRRWSYFVLPILHHDRLIGRADLAIDRKANRLVAHAIHREPDSPRGKAVARAIRRELERLAKWQGAGDLELREVPDAWPLG